MRSALCCSERESSANPTSLKWLKRERAVSTRNLVIGDIKLFHNGGVHINTTRPLDCCLRGTCRLLYVLVCEFWRKLHLSGVNGLLFFFFFLNLKLLLLGRLAGQATGKSPSATDGQSSLDTFISDMLDILWLSVTLSAGSWLHPWTVHTYWQDVLTCLRSDLPMGLFTYDLQILSHTARPGLKSCSLNQALEGWLDG